MEPMLINHCKKDEKALLEGFRLAYRTRRILFLLGAGLFVALGLWNGISTRFENPVSSLLPFVIAGLYVWIALTMASRSAKLSLRRMEETLHRRSFDVTVSFLEEALSSQSEISDTPVRIGYDVLKKILVGKDVIVLYTRSKQFVTLDRAGFEPGTEADFWRLMEEKAPKALPRSIRRRQKGG